MMRLDLRLSAWAQFIAIFAILGAGLFSHLTPPPQSTMPAASVAAFYRQYAQQIPLFAVLNAIGATLTIPGCCALSVAMRRMEPRSLLLPILQGATGMCATMGAYLGGLFFAVAALRSDSSPYVIAALNDAGVIFIEMTALPVFLQGVALAAAIFRDRSPDPILPKWLAWLYLIFGIAMQGGFLSVFFKTGPLSATGMVGLVLPIALLLVWLSGTALALFLINPKQWAEADLGLARRPMT